MGAETNVKVFFDLEAGRKKSYESVPSRRVTELFPHRIFYFIAIIFLTAVTDA